MYDRAFERYPTIAKDNLRTDHLLFKAMSGSKNGRGIDQGATAQFLAFSSANHDSGLLEKKNIFDCTDEDSKGSTFCRWRVLNIWVEIWETHLVRKFSLGSYTATNNLVNIVIFFTAAVVSVENDSRLYPANEAAQTNHLLCDKCNNRHCVQHWIICERRNRINRDLPIQSTSFCWQLGCLST